ncbi:MAG: hypothetical protein JXN59_07115 [Anaerolineae bacterium]|nr:hypothetical protein [Anaerolineae bacterium]
MQLSTEAQTILAMMVAGAQLKSHRYLDGTKYYRLHPLDAPPADVKKSSVEALLKQGMVTSNQKFPAATYMLTAKGRQLAQTLRNPS